MSTRHTPDLIAKMRPQYAAPDEKLLVHLSNFRPVKRVTDVVEVFAQVAKQLPARLMLIGDGPDRSAAEYLARKHGVWERIHFLGKQDNVNELLPLADLMIMPSEMESFGLAALEGMACRVPAIATRVGGVPELIEHGVNGILCHVGDTDEMARQALALLTDPRTPRRHAHRRPQNRAGSLLRLRHHRQIRGLLPADPRSRQGNSALAKPHR